MNDKTVDKQEQIIKIAMQLFAVKAPRPHPCKR